MSTRSLTRSQLSVARQALRDAVEKIGGPTKVAALFSPITSQAVSQWDIAPLQRVPKLHAESGVALEKLAPDMYDAAPRSKSADREALA